MLMMVMDLYMSLALLGQARLYRHHVYVPVDVWDDHWLCLCCVAAVLHCTVT